MGKSCCAYNCRNRFEKGSGITFHRFPFAKKDLLKKWILSVRRKNFFPNIHTYICSAHFTPECFYENHLARSILKEDAVPTIFNFQEPLKKDAEESEMSENEDVAASTVFVGENVGTSSGNMSDNKDALPKRKKKRLMNEMNEESVTLSSVKLAVTKQTKAIENLTDAIKINSSAFEDYQINLAAVIESMNDQTDAIRQQTAILSQIIDTFE